MISTRWVITEKEKGGQRICKARLVARGFEEEGDNLKTDSPTCASEGMKVVLTLIMKEGWNVKTLDVKTAYLQGKKMERTCYLKPPKEAMTSEVWKLNKVVYGLKDAARAWYDSLVGFLEELKGIRSQLDPTIFYWKEEGCLIGVLCTHVDDFIYGGNSQFEGSVMKILRTRLEIGLEQEKKFKYIGIEVEANHDTVSLSQAGYVQKMKIPERKRFLKDREMNSEEQTAYRSLVGQLNWLAQQTRPDIAYDVSERSQKCKGATASDMRKLIKIAEKAQSEQKRITIQKLNGPLKLEVYADAAFGGEDGNSQIGYILTMVDDKGGKAPLYWKSHKAKRVARSTLEAETLSFAEAAEVGVYLKELWKELVSEGIPIYMKTDCKSLKDNLESTSLVANKRLRIDIAAIKEMVEKGDIEKVAWISSREQLADALTKQKGEKGLLMTYLN